MDTRVDALENTTSTLNSDVAAIKAEYVSVKTGEDNNDSLYFGDKLIVFNCGSASTVI
jgi:hypothetical protein